MKKFFFSILLICALCALLHKQILGAAARLALKIHADCELAYRSLSWEDGGLVFSDLVLFDPGFHAHIEKASIRFNWSSFPKKLKGHLTIDSPHISMLKKRALPSFGESWLDFTVSINDGLLNWEGPVQFSLDHTQEESQLFFNWDDSGAVLTLHEGKLEAELTNFRAPLLKTWIPLAEILDGRITGRISLNESKELISANLTLSKIGIMRELGSIENMEGTLSYHASLGAKWELQGFGHAQGTQFPFNWKGRGFFKSHWIESEVQFLDGSCEISGAEAWTFHCRDLHSEQATLLQAGAAAFWPELASWSLERGRFSGWASFSPTAWQAQFEGREILLHKGDFTLVCDRAAADLTESGGTLSAASPEYDLNIQGKWNEWCGDVRCGALQFHVRGGWDGEKFPVQIDKGAFYDVQFSGAGWIDPNLDLSLRLDGKWLALQKEILLHCPRLSKQGSEWAFDFRCVRQTWDLCRLAGLFDGKQIVYSANSHLLGAPIQFAPAPLGALDLQVKLSPDAIGSAGPFLKEWGLDLAKAPAIAETDIHVQYAEGKTTLSAFSPQFTFCAETLLEEWKIDLQSDLTLQAYLQNNGSARGTGKWKTGLEVEFEGKIHPSLRCEFSFPKIQFDLGSITAFDLKGKLEGQGHLIYDGQLEADFDCLASPLTLRSYDVENEGALHISYSSTQGTLIRGIDLHGAFDCIVDLLEYDASRAHWIFHDAQGHIPQSICHYGALDFIADCDLAPDCSTFICTVREGLIPFDGICRHVQNLQIAWDHGICEANLDGLHRLQLHVGDKIGGRLILGIEEEPLTIDWEYGDALSIHSIEGSFGGIEASFHLESAHTLIGSARVNFTALSEFLPRDVSTVFEEIKMGRGYELKGRLKIENNNPSFHGILCGKQIELFGFQFRTLLAQVAITDEKVHIFDVNISDTAGKMTVEKILIEGKKNVPWTLAIPTLLIQEFRPSLLQRPGRPVGPISPLVVRELKCTDFKGLLERSDTYTAKGKLRFINSYKREETVFDFPANVLSRIVGLDLELLIPVTGDLEFELKNGLFNLTELTHAYSEAKRSEFFLETDPPPVMDLDGNLQIFIKMKQFVLLKFTESFLISVDGTLTDPQFRLKKKRFFGLM